SFENLQLPSASSPLAFSFGVEHRDEGASLTPDECLKLAPTSCLGGAGGYLLPIDGGFRVNEAFMEALVPLVDGKTGVQGLDLELGYRYSDYTPSGDDDTWKLGLNYRPIETLMFRVMQQRAARAPNVDELVSPVVIGLDNATQDPCSISNAAGITPQLQQLCIATGMSAGQVGTVEDIVAGQINIFEGTDLTNLPTIEQADTTTVGFVWTPEIDALLSPVFSLDYYDINIDNPIDDFAAQEILDACYQLALAVECAKVKRVGGTLTLDGSGVELLTRNKIYMQAEGIELGFSFGFDLGQGDLTFSGTANKYLTHEFRSLNELPVVDCNGYFGTSCENARPEFRMIERTTWNRNALSLSMQLRHVGAVAMELPERTTHNPNAANAYEPFYNLDAETYVDLYASYTFADKYLVSFGAMNVTDIDPPVVGNEAASTSFNSGNTFPSTYDVLGRVFTLQLSMQF
ncbi:MAG TPA: TonB-dependent receptor, partial [Gammaproteobacteria bacterium]|nr:TonB-dependent receptor [Gammaproteobacteria bacterium]